MAEILTVKSLVIKVFVCSVVLLVIMSLCALVGSQKISLVKVFTGPGRLPGENIDYEILVGVRLPRVILAALVGAALACCGAVLQAILRNPLADPYILGISSGAGLGVITAVLSGVSWSFWGGSPITVFAFGGALMTVWLVWCIGHIAGKMQVTALLLAGVVVNAFFSIFMVKTPSPLASSSPNVSTFNLLEMANRAIIPARIQPVLTYNTFGSFSVILPSSHIYHPLSEPYPC